MNKIMNILTATMLTCISVSAEPIDGLMSERPWENIPQNLEVVNISQVTQDYLNEIMRGEHPEKVVEFSAGMILPLQFFLMGELAALIEEVKEVGLIEVKQTFYTRIVGEELILSMNLKEWKPFFEFLTGNVSVILSIHNGQPSLGFGATANRRD